MFSMKEFGQRVSNLRKVRNLTQDELAKRLNVNKGHISRIERGVSSCSLESLLSLAKELHTSTDYLLTGQSLSDEDAKNQLLSAIDILSAVSRML